MVRYQKRLQFLAVALSALAGFVDALGFLTIGGFFVSFMSGNSTRLSVGIVEHTQDVIIAGALIGGFLGGVILGSLVGHVADERRKPAVLALVAALLALGAVLDQVGQVRLACGAVVLAMGAENAVFQRDGEVSIGLTYMTGTLVKLGQRLTGAMLGGPRWAWLPYLGLWLGLVTGAAAGAAVHPYYGFDALWFACAAALALCIATAFIRTE